MDKKINSAAFIKGLEELFERLRDEIQTNIAIPALPENIAELDAYIYELNNFYYRGFDEKIFPSYRRAVQEDLTSLLKLSLQENTLKEGILASIKRYAQLYNQVKKLMSALNLGKENTYDHLLHIIRQEDRRSIELASVLKAWRGRLQASAFIAGNFSDLLADKELLSHLNHNPLYSIALRHLDNIDMENPINAAAFNTIIASLRIAHNQLLQVQKDDKFTGKGISPFKSLQEIIKELAGKKPPSSIIHLSSFLADEITSRLQNLEVYARHNEQKLLTHALRHLAIFLEDLIVILEKSQHYLLSGHQQTLRHVTGAFYFQASWLDEIKNKLSSTISDLDQLLAQYPASSPSDFQHFSTQTRALLERNRVWMEDLCVESTLKAQNIFISSVYHSLLELQYLLRWLDFLEEESQGRTDIHDAYLTFLNNLDFFLNLLGNIRADLERLLASRNLARLWKDLEISVERITLERGKIFPAQYLSLLDNSTIQEKWGEYEDYSILYEEGDLFIIRVDGYYSEEIPSLIIGRRR